MKDRFIGLILIGMWILLANGCSKETTYERYIDNRTNDTLVFHFSAADAALFGGDSLLIPPKKLDRIYQQIDSEKTEYTFCDPFSLGITLALSSGRTLNKSLTESDSWTLVYNRPGNIYQCFFQIWEDDLN